jgi:hypothetical protein
LRLLVALMLGLLALALFMVWHRRLLPPLTGDEPVYLVVAESLWYDHDLNLTNNYGVHARINSVLAHPLGPSTSVRVGSSGELRPTQPVGMGLLLTPAVAIGHRGQREVQWARRLMMFLAAVLVWQLFELLAADGSLGLAAGITAGVTVAFPLVGFSNQLYPEIPAALLFTIGLRAVLNKTRPYPAIVGLTAAALPWLSLRFLPLALGLVVALALRTQDRRVSGWRPIVLAAGMLACGFGALVALDTDAVFHTPTRIAQSPINTYRIGVGGVFSPVSGVLPFAPQLALGLVGLGLLIVYHRGVGVALVIAAGVYEFVAIPFGYHGYALPGRFQVVLIPLLTLGIAQLLRTYPRLWVLFAAATTFGLIVLVQAGSQPTYGSLYLDPPNPTLPALKPLASVLPDFSYASGQTRLDVHGPSLDNSPPVALRRGTYELALRSASRAVINTRIRIETQSSETTERVTDATRVVPPHGITTVPFAVPHSGMIYRFRIEIAGVADASTDVTSLSVRLARHAESRTAPSGRDVPLGLGWMIFVLIAAASPRLMTGGYPRPQDVRGATTFRASE